MIQWPPPVEHRWLTDFCEIHFRVLKQGRFFVIIISACPPFRKLLNLSVKSCPPRRLLWCHKRHWCLWGLSTSCMAFLSFLTFPLDCSTWCTWRNYCIVVSCSALLWRLRPHWGGSQSFLKRLKMSRDELSSRVMEKRHITATAPLALFCFAHSNSLLSARLPTASSRDFIPSVSAEGCKQMAKYFVTGA